MPKKTKIKQVTKESLALKKMRSARGYTQATTAELIGVSKTSVNHFEAGWNKIPNSYINRFVEALKYTQEDWNYFLKQDESAYRLRANCISLIDQLNIDQLKLINKLLEEVI